MSAITNAPPQIAPEHLPAVPLTLEGASMLHQMMRVRWTAWKHLGAAERAEIAQQAADALAEMEREASGQSAAFSLLGHKGDLILVHFRRSFDELNKVERQLAGLRLWDYLEPSSSYLSVVELGLYESSLKTYSALAERGIAPFSPEWNAGIKEVLERQREAMRPRLYPDIPTPVICVSIPWIAGAARRRTGIPCRSANVSARCTSTAWSAADTPEK